MPTYDRQISTAKRLIAKYGKSVVFKQTIKAQNPARPWEETEIINVFNVSALFLTVGTQTQKSMMFANNADYPVGATLCYFAYPEFEPDLNTIITNPDGIECQIKTLDSLSPNGEKILYTVVLKS